MKIIKDNLKLLNIHPLVIYFVVSPDVYNVHASYIRMLNSKNEFTRNLYKFQIICNMKEYYKNIPLELQESLKVDSLFVRLLDDTDGNFYYSLQNVDFSRCYDEIERSIHSYISDISVQNISHLTERINANSKLKDRDSSTQNSLKTLLDAFKKATSVKKCSQEVLSQTIDDADNTFFKTVPLPYTQQLWLRKKLMERRNFDMPKVEIEKMIQEMWYLIQEQYDITDKETSDQIALGLCNKNDSSSIFYDQKSRIKPENEPHIEAEIRFVQKRMHNGKIKQNVCVILKINDKEVPISFNTKAETMIYVCTLLRKVKNEKLYRHEFLNNSKGYNSKFQRKTSRSWFNDVFNTLFPSMDKDFSDWYLNIQSNSGHALSQGKSQINSLIQKELAVNNADGIYYSIINISTDDNNDTYYDVFIKPEHITIPENMLFLVEQSNERVAGKYHNNNTLPICE